MLIARQRDGPVLLAIAGAVLAVVPAVVALAHGPAPLLVAVICQRVPPTVLGQGRALVAVKPAALASLLLVPPTIAAPVTTTQPSKSQKTNTTQAVSRLIKYIQHLPYIFICTHANITYEVLHYNHAMAVWRNSCEAETSNNHK